MLHYENWDNKTLTYDLNKYNWPLWALSVIRELFPNVKSLETLHEELSPAKVVVATNHVQNACSRIEFMQKFDEFVAEHIPPLIGNKKYLIQRQGTLRVVLPNQSKQHRRLAYHQGNFVGNGRGCRTIWTPFTEARDTNTMWIMNLEDSREMTKKFLSEKWSLDKFEEEAIKKSWPVNLKPGQSHLFHQELIHGNVTNKENYTRVSLDMRILIEGEEFGRRYPGGFMRLPGDYEVADYETYKDKSFITYAGWNSDFSRDIPLPMQRAIINEYCGKREIKYNNYEFENEHADWQPGLQHYIEQNPYGIVLCSIYSLTDDVDRRDELLELALERGVQLHFANEYLSLKTKEDLTKIKTYLNFAVKKKENHVWETN